MMRAQIHSEATGHRPTHQSEVTLYPLESDFIIKQCRICLVSQDGDDNTFISPCRCLGSVKYVHKECLRQWLQAKILKEPIENQQNIQHINCELCKFEIRVILQTHKILYNCEKIQERINEKISLFLVCIVGILFSLILLGYSCVQLITNIKSNQSLSGVENSIFVMSIIINSLLFIFFTISIVPYFIESKNQVKLVQN